MEYDFTCPVCGGHHFGRDTAGTFEGQIVILDTLRCHDEREVGCRWRGRWPMDGSTPKIYRELAEMRATLDAAAGIESVPISDAVKAEVARILKERGFPQYQDKDQQHDA